MGGPESAAGQADLAGQWQYDAFISYRHVEPDRKWAKWLHSALETYRVPGKLVRERGIAPRVGRVFRDEEELPASADLSREIESALRDSRFLIVVCSPRTAESEWVNKESLRFREMGRGDHILALLIEGEPGEAFPRALREIRRTIVDSQGLTREQIEEVEPLAADVRPLPARRESARVLRRMARMRLLACILGCRFDDLRQREQERQTRRLAYLGGLMTALFAVMAVLAGFAVYQKWQADHQRELAHDALIKEAAALQEQKRQTELANQRLELAQRGTYNIQLARVRDLWRQRPVEALRQLEDLERCPARLRDFTWGFYYRLVKAGRVTLPGHDKRVNSLAFSPDGGTLASAGGDGTVKLWDAVTGRRRATLAGHDDWIDAVAFSPDGKTLASASTDKKVILWDLATRQQRATLSGHSDAVVAVAFSRDGETLVSASFRGVLKFWNPQTGELLRTANADIHAVRELEFSPDGKTLAVVSSVDGIRLWDAETGRPRQDVPTCAMAIAFAPDGRMLATAGGADAPLNPLVLGGHGLIKLWEIDTNRQRAILSGHSGALSDVAFSPDGRFLASADRDETIKLWDVETARERISIELHTDDVSCLAFSPDGRTLASGSQDMTIVLWNVASTLDEMATGMQRATLNMDNEAIQYVDFSADGSAVVADGLVGAQLVQVWDAKTGRERPRLEEFPFQLVTGYDIALSPDGKTLACACDDTTIRIWDTQTGRQRISLSGHAGKVTCVAFSPDGKTLLSASEDKTVKLWDMQTRQQVTFRQHQGEVFHAAFSPDGQTFLSISEDETVKLCDTKTGRERLTLKKAKGVGSVAFSPDGKTLAAAGEDNTIALWDVADGREQATLEGLNDSARLLTFSPDGKLLALSGDATITLWELATGERLASFQGDAERVHCAVFSPDGRTLASGGLEKTIKLWDPRTGQRRAAIAGHTQGIISLAFSPDGKTLASAGWDKTIRLWDSQYQGEKGSEK